MTEPFISEIRIVAFNFAPTGWAFCNGQLMAINQNQALFALVGTTYGGNGIQNFALPNFQGRIPIGQGTGAFGTSYVMGQQGGQANHTLLQTEMPAHTHSFNTSTGNTATNIPSGDVLAQTAAPIYTATPGSPLVAMNPNAVSNVGGSQPHNNMMPYLGLYFIIALVGIFPSRN